ncbi:conserved hypothetical protein [Talaromyces stipitatus ATCC 10500]|uniref:Uncharacterized protein n=1 Tax=Talaromyces stipitatus (strain ATCC 10500 / CBS 375.48 / QM 6759 / NRRL 1006) TaxID=441959 RepID=B8LTU7_TALSN|nr:uncharacterized protein TSTA_071730 [Talaromyces stipitatus ATCC 10500]EED23777.1 conserved hypothetical protein [Talaromyces stipitatus ATCC 10500]
MESYRPSSHSPFRSRRSHPALNHISLAPLTPRFPIDDLPEQDDYFQSAHGQSTSYLSSSSVPNTPPILSHSRASSRTRHHRRSKSSNHTLSDTDLRSLGARRGIHHQQAQTGASKSGSHTPGSSSSTGRRKSQDSEWLLRAGLALTSSTREEKGQSWLVKRESSTSLVAEAEPDVIRITRHHRRGRSTPFRSARSSAVSTPAALSRRPSRSREHSRYASRADFGMTSMDVESGGASRHSRKSSMGSYHATLPDFVDARIRAEIASINGRNLEDYDDDYEDNLSGSSFYDSESESDDEMDEREFQRLTRERGFGLGTWVDQFVSWTLFGIEEEVSTSPAPASAEESSRHAIVAFEPASATIVKGESIDDDSDGVVDRDEATGPVERAGDKGGWADATWFLRIARKAII